MSRGANWSDEFPQFAHTLAHDVAITGKLCFPSNARIDGRLRGEVRADELLVIGPGATVRGTVRARRLVVFGELHGRVRQSVSVELRPGSLLVGSIETRGLTVHAGAWLEAACSVGKPNALKSGGGTERETKPA